MSRPDPLGDLLRCADIVAASDPDLGRWLLSGLMSYVRNDEPLDRSFSLRGSLGRSPRFTFLRAKRDAHLAHALQLLGGNYATLAEEVRRVCRAPTSIMELPEPPPSWPEARQAIHRAAAVGLSLPETRDGLRRALPTKPPPVAS